MEKLFKPLPLGTAFLLAGLAAGLFIGCAAAPKQDRQAFVSPALKATDGTKTRLSDAAETEIISRFEKFNGDISTNNILNHLGEVYAADLYFCDPFKQIHGLADFKSYLLKDSDAVAQYTMDWQDVGKSDGDYYFRWVMSVKLKRDSKDKPPTQTCGMSHVRFGADGKVVYEQDIFDAAAFLYEQIPILGGEIRFIKKRL
jgi:hypothetical protein